MGGQHRFPLTMKRPQSHHPYLPMQKPPPSSLRAANTPAAVERGHRTRRRQLVMLFVALLLLVPLIALTVIKLYTPEVERDTYANLQAIAKLKAGQIENWLDERQRNAAVIMANETLNGQIGQLAAGTLNASKQVNLKHYLESLVQQYGYVGIVVLSSERKVLMAIGSDPKRGAAGSETELEAAAQRLATLTPQGHIERSGIYLDALGHPLMHWIVPIGQSRSATEQPSATVVLRINVENFIFPVIQAWPTASPSGETLLIRREGNTAVFMNQLRHRAGTVLTLAPSMDTPGLPAAQAIRENAPGTFEGWDYRQIAVMTAFRPVK